MEDFKPNIFLICVVGFQAISSLILTDEINRRQYIFNSNNDVQKITFKVRNIPNNKPKQIGIYLNNTNLVKTQEDLDALVRNVVFSYIALNYKSIRQSSDPHDAKEVKLCEAACKNRIRNTCVYGNYLCTDFTVDYLSHSCYSECNYHLTDPNPYREYLYAEKFRKVTTTTAATTPLTHPSVRPKTTTDAKELD